MQGRKTAAEVYNFKETLIKAFPAPDLRRKAANSFANPCTFTGVKFYISGIHLNRVATA